MDKTQRAGFCLNVEKKPENGAESHTSGAPQMSAGGSFFTRERGRSENSIGGPEPPGRSGIIGTPCKAFTSPYKALACPLASSRDPRENSGERPDDLKTGDTSGDPD